MQNTAAVEWTGAHAEARPRQISYGALAAVGLFALALVLRLMALEAVPMAVRETPNALAALRAVSPTTPGDPLTSSSVAVFLAQAASFTALGSGAFAARFLTALAGACLVVAPMAFQRRLGLGWAFTFSLALACSPALLLASRDSATEVWALLLLVVALWSLMRYRVSQAHAYAIGGVTAAVSAALLTGWSGLILTGIVLVSAWLTLREKPEPEAVADDEAEPAEPTEHQRFPWLASVGVAALTVGVASTVFMLYPAGLDSIAAALGGVVEHLGPLQGPLPLHGLLASVFYETTAWVFGVVAIVLVLRRGSAGPIERFLIVWLGLGLVASLAFYSAPEQALWTTIPLAGLVGRLLVDLLRADHRAGEYYPYTARLVSALIAGSLLFIFTLAFQSFARALAKAPAGELASAPIEPTSVILMAVMGLFAGVMFVLGVSLWNRRTVLQGAALAVLIFGGLASLGAGWYASVPNAADPVEPWHFTATNADTILLSVSLEQLQDRQSGGLPLLPLAVDAAQDGVTAWLVRDYSNATFVEDVRQAAGAEVVLSESASAPDLGSAYVGQDFLLTRTWPPEVLYPSEWPAWWSQRLVYPAARAAALSVTGFLWVRQDIYDGVSLNEAG